MKNLTSLLFLFLLSTVCSVDAQSQEPFNFEYVTLGQGQSPVADGLKFTAVASRGDDVILTAFGTTNAYFIYQWSNVLGIKGLSAGPSGGFFSGVPWVGPIVTYSPAPFIEMMGWIGPSTGNAVAGEFDLGNIELAFVQLDLKLNFTENAYAGVSYLEFGGESVLPYVGGAVPLGSAMAIFSSVTYDIKNENPMFFMGFKLGF